MWDKVMMDYWQHIKEHIGNLKEFPEAWLFSIEIAKLPYKEGSVVKLVLGSCCIMHGISSLFSCRHLLW